MGIKYSHLSEGQRALIEAFSRLEIPPTVIARHVRVDRSTVYRELRRGCLAPQHPYIAVFGQRFYDTGRRRAGQARRKLGTDLCSPAWLPVLAGLRAGWSPQQIHGRSKMLDYLISFAPRARVLPSHETIYRAIFSLPHSPQRGELTTLLRLSQGGRRRRRDRKSRFTGLRNITRISQRPAHVLERLEPGHWEGDIMKGANGQSFVGTLVERVTRFTIVLPLRNASAGEYARALIARLRTLPPHLRRSLTYDRGTEMALHEHITATLHMPVFFCEPYSPWQRPTNENTNGLLRQYLPRSIDLSRLTAEQLMAVENALNNRPRAVLGFRTPNEALRRLIG